MPDYGCPECRVRIEAASVATRRHIQAISRLQLAVIRREHDLVPSLQVVVEDARRNREQAVRACKQHLGAHAVADSKVCA
jgi:hypothetical protein